MLTTYRGITMTGAEWCEVQLEASRRSKNVPCSCGGFPHSEECAIEVAWLDAIETIMDERSSDG